jgi:hypothetical protein
MQINIIFNYVPIWRRNIITHLYYPCTLMPIDKLVFISNKFAFLSFEVKILTSLTRTFLSYTLLSRVQTCCVSPYRISVSYPCGRYPVSSFRCKMLIRWCATGCSLTWRSFPVASKGRHALQWGQSGRARVASRCASQFLVCIWKPAIHLG